MLPADKAQIVPRSRAGPRLTAVPLTRAAGQGPLRDAQRLVAHLFTDMQEPDPGAYSPSAPRRDGREIDGWS